MISRTRASGMRGGGGGEGTGGKADSWVFSLSQIYLFLFDVWECLLRACMGTTHMSGDHRGQKRALQPLELE